MRTAITTIHASSVINDIVRVRARGSGFRIERIFRYGYRRFDGRTVGRPPMKESWRKLVIRDGTEAGARGALDFDLEDDPWIIIRAVDSSFWEVFSDRQDVLDAIRARFRVVDDEADEMEPKRAFRINPAGAALAAAIVTCIGFGVVSIGFYASTGGLLIVGAAAACAFLATFLATSVP
jgi:hypothetical protein